MTETQYPGGSVVAPDGATIVIPLTQGQATIIDAADYPLIAPFKWWTQKTPTGFYAVTKIRGSDGKRRGVQMQRLIMGQPDCMVDHASRDTLDNRRANLRHATPSQNKANTPRYRNNQSGFKGVYKRGRYERWSAQIGQDGKVRHIGYFPTPEAAALAYDARAREIHGPFARCNFPEN